jgi:hypothetical protein
MMLALRRALLLFAPSIGSNSHSPSSLPPFHLTANNIQRAGMSALTSSPSTVAPTERLYLSYSGNFLTSCEAVVTSCEVVLVPPSSSSEPTTEEQLNNNTTTSTELILTFDRSCFHPQGGGQPSDIGAIMNTSKTSGGAEFVVSKCSYDFGTQVVSHRGVVTSLTPIDDPSSLFRVGDTCQLEVDADQRNEYSQIHSAGQ